jgi:hypothetical protein
VLAAFMVISCTKKKVEDAGAILGLGYYSIQIGKYVVYDVDSTVYNDLTQTSILYKYRIKEKFADYFTDNEGRKAIRIERYIKKYDPNKSYDSIPYIIKEVWMANVDEKKVQVVESNIRYTKLIFPIQQNANWNGNANNTLGAWNYTYSYIDKAETINGVNLNNVLLVVQKDDKTLISQQYYIEKYAKEIGLVYREIKDIYSNTVVPNVPVDQRIEKGIIFKQTIVSYGNE